MDSNKVRFNSVEDYIASFPADTQKTLNELRATIHATAPGIEEKISYDMPTFTLNGKLIYFAAWKKHIALYGAKPAALESLKNELIPYAGTKGSLHFPLDKSLPLDLISNLVKFGVEENLKNAKTKPGKKK